LVFKKIKKKKKKVCLENYLFGKSVLAYIDLERGC